MPVWLAKLLTVAVLVLCTTGLIYALDSSEATAGGIANIPTGLIAVFVLLVLLSGAISSGETAIFSLDKLDLARMRGSDHAGDQNILTLMESQKDTLLTLLIANNLVNIAITLASNQISGIVFGASAPGETNWTRFAVTAVGATSIILMFGEILPKTIAKARPLALARTLSFPLVFAMKVLHPGWINGWLEGLYHFLHIPADGAEEELSGEEFVAMISSGPVSHVLDEGELDMIDRVFDLRKLTVAEIITPRTSVTAVPDNLPQDEMIQRLKDSPNSRVLIYEETLDNLKGFLLVKQVLLDPETDWHRHIREVLMVPEGIGLLDMLKHFRQERTKLAAVVDEYGQVAGIVTLQDVLEEIVGDIYESHEPPEQEIMPIDPAHWQVAGSTHLAELTEELDVDFPTNQSVTVGGFVMNSLGRMPRTGDQIDHGPLRLRVEEMAGRRVHSVLIERTDTESANGSPALNGEDAQ